MNVNLQIIGSEPSLKKSKIEERIEDLKYALIQANMLIVKTECLDIKEVYLNSIRYYSEQLEKAIFLKNIGR